MARSSGLGTRTEEGTVGISCCIWVEMAVKMVASKPLLVCAAASSIPCLGEGGVVGSMTVVLDCNGGA